LENKINPKLKKKKKEEEEENNSRDKGNRGKKKRN
jgi:hypothetical protein